MHGRFSTGGLFPNIESCWVTFFSREVTRQKVHDMLFNMTPLKAPSIDDLHAQFCQSQWSVVGDSLFSLVNKGFKDDTVEEFFNKTPFVLILKVVGPEVVSQFCPISLCTVSYKVLIKVIANHLKPLCRC